MLLEEKSSIPVVKAQLEYLASMQESLHFWEGIDLERSRGAAPAGCAGWCLSSTRRNARWSTPTSRTMIMGVRDGDARPHAEDDRRPVREEGARTILRNHLDHIVIHRSA